MGCSCMGVVYWNYGGIGKHQRWDHMNVEYVFYVDIWILYDIMLFAVIFYYLCTVLAVCVNIAKETLPTPQLFSVWPHNQLNFWTQYWIAVCFGLDGVGLQHNNVGPRIFALFHSYNCFLCVVGTTYRKFHKLREFIACNSMQIMVCVQVMVSVLDLHSIDYRLQWQDDGCF
jgi:hypothetical protein